MRSYLKGISKEYDEVVYEERVVVFKASSFDEAIVLGEAEAEAYAGGLEATSYTGFISAYHPF